MSSARKVLHIAGRAWIERGGKGLAALGSAGTRLAARLSPAGRPANALDGLRAIAILLVVLSHTSDVAPLAGQGLLGRPAGAFLNLGWVGVDLFFVLSGYLIGGQILRDVAARSFHFSIFYVKRVLRIFPAYYVSILLTVVLYTNSPLFVATYNQGQPADVWSILRNLFYLQNYFWPPLQTVYWTLAIEEHFYLVLPPLLLALWREINPYRRLGWLAVAMGACFFARSVAFLLTRGDDPTHAWVATGVLTHTRLDSLLLGVACAEVVRLFGRRLAGVPALAPALLAVGSVLVGASILLNTDRWGPPPDHYYGLVASYTVLDLGWALVLLHVVLFPSHLVRLLSTGWLYVIATLSYTIYLHHFPIVSAVGHSLRALVPMDWHTPYGLALMFALSLSTSVAAALALYVAIEMPFLRLKEALFSHSGERVPPRAAV